MPAFGSVSSNTSVIRPTVSTYTVFEPFSPESSCSIDCSMPALPTTSLFSYDEFCSFNVASSVVDTVPVYPRICEQYTLSTYLRIYCCSTVTPASSSEFSRIAATVWSETSLAIVKLIYLLYEFADIKSLKLIISSTC